MVRGDSMFGTKKVITTCVADTGQLISDAEVAETSYPLRLGRQRTLTVRLVVRRVKDVRLSRRCHN